MTGPLFPDRSRYSGYDNYRESYGQINHRLTQQRDQLRLLREAAKKVEETMPKTMSEAASHVAAKKVAVNGLRTLKGFVGLLLLLGLAAVAWGILAGGVLALFTGVGPVIWFIIGGIATMIVSGGCFYGITVEELPEKMSELASAQAVYDDAVKRAYEEHSDR